MMFETLKPQPYLVLGTSTDIGKTFFVTEVCKKLRQKNIEINAIKPLASGFEDGDLESDTVKILQSLGLEPSLKNIDKTTPFRLKEPFSPLKAAKMAGKLLNFNEIVNFCQKEISENQGKTLLIEAAGGVMTPINEEKTFLDLAEALDIPVFLLGGVYLGAISHILCSVLALNSRKIAINSIIINNFGNKNQNLSENDIISEVEVFTKIPVFSLTNL